MTDQAALILPLTSASASLELAGGKGANLAKLAAAGFPVPPGFIISAAAYLRFLEDNLLQGLIQAAISGIDESAPDDLEKASQRIRAAFANGRMPGEISDAIIAAYQSLGCRAVAVRSSATVEDLPELSFAGQQDTFLNITTQAELLSRVIDCWSSLWTARAIGYRVHAKVPQESISIAVVVQAMVESETSGVLFTANPVTGLRSETVIDATLGLGEPLVSGQVEPDHYVVDVEKKEIKLKQLGAKKISIRAIENGGTQRIIENAANSQALEDDQILLLASMGQKVKEVFGTPQDIEWAFSKGGLFLLQTRPITSLFPLPDGLPEEPLKVFFSFANVQGIMDPITPIGRSAIKSFFVAGAGRFGIKTTEETQTILYTAGERLWANITPVVRNSFGRKVLPVVMEFAEPTISQTILQVQDDPRLQPGRQGVSLHARLQLARFLIPVAGNVLLNLLFPAMRRKIIVANGEKMIEKMNGFAIAPTGDGFERLAYQTGLFSQFLKKDFPHTLTLFISGVASGVFSLNMLNMLSKKIDGNQSTEIRWNDLVLQITRGIPFNPTTEMDLALWRMAQVIRADAPSRELFDTTSPAECSHRYQIGTLPEALTCELTRFLDVYGGRGLGEIDLGRTRWADDPTHVFEMLASFLQIEDPGHAPDTLFRQGASSAEQAIEQITAAVRKSRGGFIKARLVRFFAGRTRQLMGMRESPKFFLVRLMGSIQKGIKLAGQALVEQGEMKQADDLFYLSFTELSSLARRDKRDWASLIAERRASYQRELRRRQLPRLLLSDGRAFFEGMTSATDTVGAGILGSPVSPGVVEGLVRVVLDPTKAGLKPGEIMVCPGTDPSWTPLFMTASGLVMEVGGMMTHGAVVARELGIPAVVGVTRATERLTTGVRIRLNGSNGEITLLE